MLAHMIQICYMVMIAILPVTNHVSNTQHAYASNGGYLGQARTLSRAGDLDSW